MGERFDPAKADHLLDPARKAWYDPDRVLTHLDLGRGRVVADVGCGPGWFTLPLAERVAPDGLVYAIDVEEKMLERLMERAKERAVANIRPVLAEEEDEFPVPSSSCDAALVASVYHEVDPTSSFANEVRRILRPGGVCLLIEWRPEPTPVGPPQHERLSPDDVIREWTAAGFEAAGPVEVGPYHYGIMFHAVKGSA
ncbi:class I SAM-dependent methyltransferase [Caldinitratiruptor microaerophilus]|uniref:Methyltransferase type 11 n=1 Tax=Caldinitratiruptor microaerophilus TaxID=671077 RepID=A0AA35CQT8_9FIRM|nr:methyltransferase domain-containing protein [Caldinitratiruptor microaerophilus]BDG62261.1 methyltransferase type 11 [Caldinitratiruptor microaerophilus]